ncbi:MAG: hypothetical protein ABIQ40_19000 [Bacteroidia bacterium]
MKKLAITSVAVLIALIGFTAILVFLPCGDGCHGKKDGCELREAKCSGDKKDCTHAGKCGDEKSGCEMGKGHHDGCGSGNEKCSMKEWTDADGKCHKEVKVVINGDGKGDMHGACPMENADHSGCCGCCPMKNGGANSCHGDAEENDSVKVKVRGKL